MRAAIAVLASVVASGPSIASADILRTTLDEPLEEVAHTIDVQVADGVATYVVQRQIKNPGKRADEARFVIDLPAGGSATGLRIRAKDRWYSGELLESETAARQYEQLTGAGVYDPRDPALLFWLEPNKLALQIFPVFPGGVSTVEYTITAPVKYEHGRAWITYPRLQPIEDRRRDRTLVMPVIRVAGGTRTEVGRGSDPWSIGVAPSPIATWTGRLARVVASEQHTFVRFELDAAPQLSALPKRAQVVFVMDASYSIGEDRRDAELAMMKAYAKHVPDADIEVVVVRRTAKRAFDRFVRGSDFAETLDAYKRLDVFGLDNGSALDAGAKLAARALAGRPGPHRVVLLTDTLLRGSLSEKDALASLSALDAAAVVHVVVPETGATETELVRDDNEVLSPLALRHHGIYANLGVAPKTDLAPTVLELVRPTKIDNLTSSAANVGLPSKLVEGEGEHLAFEATRGEAPTRVHVSGDLWADPVRMDVNVSPSFSTATAAFVFGDESYNSLDNAEMMTVAKLGRVVSPVTSYLAIEPGVRPSKIGIEDRGGSGNWGAIGSGRYGTIGVGSGTSSRTPPDLAAKIYTKRCEKKFKPAADWHVELEIETTRDEIVDVQLKTPASPFADCLVEAAWAVRLDARFDQERETFSIQLDP
jgi:vault protein inter-alpha-trypsin-like protein/VWA domain-containing protein